MTRILFADTETTGKWEKFQRFDSPDQPDMVQLAVLLCCAETGKEYNEFSTLIQPNGWLITPEAQAVHGITIEECRRFGIPILSALHVIAAMPADVFCAFNLQFDESIIRLACLRAGRSPVLNRIPQRYDPMKAAVNLCRIPGQFPGQYKWPKLEEAYKILCKKEIENAHDAMADVRAMKEVYFEIKARTEVSF